MKAKKTTSEQENEDLSGDVDCEDEGKGKDTDGGGDEQVVCRKNFTDLVPHSKDQKKRAAPLLLSLSEWCRLNGIGLLNKKNHIDNYIEINHNEKHTSSNLNFNNILNDYSKGIFYAKTVINKQCSQSEASQSNKNMLLSKSSSMQSNPQLIINNDDVQCSHGSTTGEIDSDALFRQTRN